MSDLKCCSTISQWQSLQCLTERSHLSPQPEDLGCNGLLSCCTIERNAPGHLPDWLLDQSIGPVDETHSCTVTSSEPCWRWHFCPSPQLSLKIPEVTPGLLLPSQVENDKEYCDCTITEKRQSSQLISLRLGSCLRSWVKEKLGV